MKDMIKYLGVTIMIILALIVGGILLGCSIAFLILNPLILAILMIVVFFVIKTWKSKKITN